MGPLQVTVQGMLKPDGTVEVKARLSWPPGAVRVTIEPLEQAGRLGPNVVEVMEEIRKGQKESGHRGPTPEEMEATIGELREDEAYEKRWQEIWASCDSPAPPARDNV